MTQTLADRTYGGRRTRLEEPSPERVAHERRVDELLRRVLEIARVPAAAGQSTAFANGARRPGCVPSGPAAAPHDDNEARRRF